MSSIKKNSALIYEGTYQAINYLPDADAQLEAYRGIIEYGLYGTEPHSDNPIVNTVYAQAIPCLNKARERYQKAVENGRKGGRPAKINRESVRALKENGRNIKEIAAEMGTTENTIKSIIYRDNKADLRDEVVVNTNIEHAASMILYYSAYEAVCYIPDEKLQLEALKGLLEYGFRGVKPQSDNPFVNMVYATCTPSMKAAKQRYAKTIIDGKKGGRPSEMSIDDIMAMRRVGMSNREIADSFGVTVKAVEARITRYNQDNLFNKE